MLSFVDKVEAARLEGLPKGKGEDKMERERTRVQQVPWTPGPHDCECRAKGVETRRTQEQKVKKKTSNNQFFGRCPALTSEVGLYTWRSLLRAYIGKNKDWYKMGKECQQVSVTMKTEFKDSIL